MTENFLGKLKKFHFPVLAIGFYRFTSIIDASNPDKTQEVKGPYPNRLTATPLTERLSIQSFVGSSNIKFCFFRPNGAVKPDPIELERVK